MTFAEGQAARLLANHDDAELALAATTFLRESFRAQYCYNFAWLGRPIIQYPQDIVGLAQTIWETRPTLVVETGVAHGGSLIFYASMLALIQMRENPAQVVGDLLSKTRVVGVEIDLRPHNRLAINEHFLGQTIELVDGPSTADATIERVTQIAQSADRVMVVLDSNHSYSHVRDELNRYSPLVTPGGALVVFDTLIDELPAGFLADRPWGPGDSPATAVSEFLAKNPEFEVDTDMDASLMFGSAKGGYLRRRNVGEPKVRAR